LGNAKKELPEAKAVRPTERSDEAHRRKKFGEAAQLSQRMADLAGILTVNKNVWNKVRVESFDDNPNATNELKTLVQKNLAQVE
jgi:hypothetical protein